MIFLNSDKYLETAFVCRSLRTLSLPFLAWSGGKNSLLTADLNSFHVLGTAPYDTKLYHQTDTVYFKYEDVSRIRFSTELMGLGLVAELRKGQVLFYVEKPSVDGKEVPPSIISIQFDGLKIDRTNDSVFLIHSKKCKSRGATSKTRDSQRVNKNVKEREFREVEQRY